MPAISGTPLGLVYKNGTMIKELPVKNYYFLALLKNKTTVIGNVNDYQMVKTQIIEALNKEGQYETINRPSDNSERSVANAWTILREN